MDGIFMRAIDENDKCRIASWEDGSENLSGCKYAEGVTLE